MEARAMAAGFGIAFVFPVAFSVGGAVGKDGAFRTEVAVIVGS